MLRKASLVTTIELSHSETGDATQSCDIVIEQIAEHIKQMSYIDDSYSGVETTAMSIKQAYCNRRSKTFDPKLMQLLRSLSPNSSAQCSALREAIRAIKEAEVSVSLAG